MTDETKRVTSRRHLRYGLAFERAQRPQAAADHYRQAIAADPNLRDAHNALAFHYQQQGLLAKAADEFATVANLADDYFAHFNLGFVLIELERYDEAEREFRRCLELDPDDTAARLELAYINIARGHYTDALNLLAAPLQHYHHDWAVYHLLGRCLFGLQRYDEAQQAWQQALQRAPTPEAQLEALAHLQKIERQREFRVCTSLKDEYYIQSGAICLGSAMDNGLNIQALTDYHLRDIDVAVTLQRFIALAQSSHWQFAGVVAPDLISKPVATALAELLAIPLLNIHHLPDVAAPVLIALAVGESADLFTLTRERIPVPSPGFCLALNWGRHSKLLPEVIGIVVHGVCTVPWAAELRATPATAQADAIRQIASRLVEHARTTPPEDNLPRQIRYYTRNHRRTAMQPLLLPAQSSSSASEPSDHMV